MRLEYFEMIDAVTEYDPSRRRLVASSRVPMESPVFEGHFPGHPLVPGVLLTETMAQASGYLVLALMRFSHMPFLMGVDEARFRQFVPPGTLLETEALIDQEGSGYVATRARIRIDGKLTASAGLRFALQPFPAGMGDLMHAQARRIGLGPEVPA
jgi:3-hydroxyacyl-[acyl-carrier-protein] dehydratase